MKGETAMETTLEQGILTAFVEGKIDHANAGELADELDRITAQPHDALVLDARSLRYLSSAGLRVLLTLRRREPTLRIVNAAPEVYDIFEMTGFTEMMPIERSYRELSVDGCEIIGRGAKGTVYRYDAETIVKVYKKAESLPDAQRERELAKRAFVLDIPTAISYEIVKVGDRYGSVFELLNAASYTSLILQHPEKLDAYVKELAALLRKIHATGVRASDMPDVKAYAGQWLSQAAPYLPAQDAEKLQTLVAQVPDRMTMLHGDYHTNNILCQNGEMILIDMDTLCHGHPIFDLCNMYLAYVGHGAVDPTAVERFLGMPYTLAGTVWEKFLPAYLETTDEETIRSVGQKAELLAAVRLLRHTVRRMTEQTEERTRVIENCRARISRLLPDINTLDF